MRWCIWQVREGGCVSYPPWDVLHGRSVDHGTGANEGQRRIQHPHNSGSRGQHGADDQAIQTHTETHVQARIATVYAAERDSGLGLVQASDLYAANVQREWFRNQYQVRPHFWRAQTVCFAVLGETLANSISSYGECGPNEPRWGPMSPWGPRFRWLLARVGGVGSGLGGQKYRF